MEGCENEDYEQAANPDMDYINQEMGHEAEEDYEPWGDEVTGWASRTRQDTASDGNICNSVRNNDNNTNSAHGTNGNNHDNENNVNNNNNNKKNGAATTKQTTTTTTRTEQKQQRQQRKHTTAQ